MITKDRALASISDVLEETIGVKPKPSQSLKQDLDMDSLDIVELAVQLEKDLTVTIPDEDLAKFDNMTVDQVADYLVSIVR